MDQPIVSVVLAVYNGERYVIEAIDSVLQQTIPLELIIIDDGSTDNTAALIKSHIKTQTTSHRIHYHYQTNQGLATSQNNGIATATAPYLAFIDADDIWQPNKLAMQYKILTDRPDLDMVFGHVQQFHSPDLSKEKRQRIYCPTSKQPALLAVAMLIRKTSQEKVGNYNPQWRKGPFIDWFARAQEAGLNYLIPDEIVFRRRLHDNNMGITERDEYGDYARLLKAALDRRRQLTTASTE